MKTSSMLPSSNRRSIPARQALALAAVVAGVVAGYVASSSNSNAAAQSRDKVSLKEMPSVTGTVDAARPFKAAQVYLRNTDRRMSYMVYTQAGKFRAVALLAGNYEISAEAKGLQSDVQKLVIRNGDNPQVKIALRDAASAERFPGAGSAPPRELTLASYDEVYPPGAGKRVVEEVCMTCHGENFIPGRPSNAAGWQAALDLMMGRGLHDRDRTNPYEGILAPPATNFRFGLQDRKDLLEYLIKNFGADSKRRAVRPETETPIDEAKLAKAQYIEYFLTPDAQSGGAAAGQPRGELAQSRNRILYTIQLDAQGNAWGVDRSSPNRLVKLDPRTGEQQDFVLPDPRAGVHEILIDREGMVWVPELGGTPGTRVYRLLGFNPKTEKWEKIINADPDDVIRNPNKVGMHASVIDSKGNIYMNWFGMGAIGRYDRQTGKVEVFRIPMNSAIPYGMAVDKNDNIWSALWNFGKLTKFDPTTKQWTEFTPPTYPSNMRRGVGIDSKNNVWTGIYAAGNRPAKLAKLDQTTGRITEFTIPRRGSMPYEATADLEDNIWFPDTSVPVNQPVIGKFDPRDQSFTFYPKPQVGADSPKLQHTADGAVWYTARTATPGATAFGVLYPDKDKITTLGAYPLNGAPGYAFKVGRATN
jgi:streptogramin lyase/mono/diheme cytochrome c family protein